MKKILILSLLMGLFLSQSTLSFAHCDTRDGPVVKAAAKAIQSNNINFALVWVQPAQEAELKTAFAKTMSIRKLNKNAQELADEYFYETIVRLHRLGEGESYTGIKNTAPEDFVVKAENAIARKSTDSLFLDLSIRMQQNLDEYFLTTLKSASYNHADVKAGRAHVASYIKFLHYVESLYALSASDAASHKEHEQKEGHAALPVTSGDSPDQNQFDSQFYLLLMAAFVIMGLLMVVSLLLGKNLRLKTKGHDFHNGLAEHLA